MLIFCVSVDLPVGGSGGGLGLDLIGLSTYLSFSMCGVI